MSESTTLNTIPSGLSFAVSADEQAMIDAVRRYCQKWMLPGGAHGRAVCQEVGGVACDSLIRTSTPFFRDQH